MENNVNQNNNQPKGPTKVCKHCKSEIPKGAKVCPHCRKKQKKPILLFVIIGIILIGVIGGGGSEETSSTDTSTNTKVESNVENKVEQKEEVQEVEETSNVIGIGEEFGNKTMTCKVVEFNENYTDYEAMLVDVPEGKKCIFITVEMNNKSSSDNYVSIGDFDCYVDNVLVESELFTGSDLAYNANISAGRTARLGGLYVVPDNCSSIELEYHPIGEKNGDVIVKLK